MSGEVTGAGLYVGGVLVGVGPLAGWRLKKW